MACWEFHHHPEDPPSWSWMAHREDGTVSSRSEQRFPTLMAAMDHAVRNGFTRDRDRWYLATDSSRPCLQRHP